MQELTITQNSALYLAQHRISRPRTAFIRRLRIAHAKQSPDIQRRTLRVVDLAPPLYPPDNGR